jgi:hypothetical protein
MPPVPSRRRSPTLRMGTSRLGDDDGRAGGHGHRARELRRDGAGSAVCATVTASPRVTVVQPSLAYNGLRDATREKREGDGCRQRRHEGGPRFGAKTGGACARDRRGIRSPREQSTTRSAPPRPRAPSPLFADANSRSWAWGLKRDGSGLTPGDRSPAGRPARCLRRPCLQKEGLQQASTVAWVSALSIAASC